MKHTDILYYQSNKKEIDLSHQCKAENGIVDDEKFVITNVIGNFEKLEITNQYDQKFVINPNQINN